MEKTYYICKYTPVELLKALGGECEELNHMPDGFDKAESCVGANICGYGKSVIDAVMDGKVHELILTTCCDSIKAVYDTLKASGKLSFLFMLDLPHDDGICSRQVFTAELLRLAREYSDYKGTSFSREKFLDSFTMKDDKVCDHIAVMGARVGDGLSSFIRESMPLPVKDYTCINNRSVMKPSSEGDSFEELMEEYASLLLGELPCLRMTDVTGRKRILDAPGLKGIIYNTVRFCDFYGFEYAALLRTKPDVPMIKIETDFTTQSRGQMRTRLEAFNEELGISTGDDKKKERNIVGKGYFAGIDSGSTSTDVVILDKNKEMAAGIIIPTGAGAALSAGDALKQACAEAGINEEDIDRIITTGYGRDAIDTGDKSITEITCHAKGAHFLDPSVRTVIDIGGQDSKAIHLDENGNVVNFAMNDKCAAGTGRFLDMMAHTMQMSLDEMSELGLSYDEDITISSMCSVFAESEVVSLVAQNKKKDDIVHGINKAVALKTLALVKRVSGESRYMMTGGVAKNKGLVATLSEMLKEELSISENAQLCGALGAALFAMGE